MRGSLLTYLLCLSMVPMLAFTAIAGFLATKAFQQATSAQRLQQAMRRVESLDLLQRALIQENVAVSLASTGGSVGGVGDIKVSPEALRGTGLQILPAPEARKITDQRLAQLAADPETAEVAQKISVDRAAIPRGQNLSLDVASGNVAAFFELIRTSQRAEIAASQNLSSGRYGSGGSQVAARAGQLTAITLLVAQANELVSSLYQAMYGPESLRARPGSKLSVEALEALDGVRAAASGYRVLSDMLTPSLLDPVAGQWATFRAATSRELTDNVVPALLSRSAGQDGRPAGAATSQISLMITAGLTMARFSQQLTSMFTTAVQQGVDAAAADRTRSTQYAIGALALLGGLAIVIAAMLALIWRAISRRLSLLTRAAQRLSSGEFDEVSLRGPRELELAARGMNDAALNLRKVMRSAECVATGDLAAPDLQVPIQGRLGATVHAAFQRIVDVIRERDRLQVELSHQATHDSLTGLPNRAYAEELLTEALGSGRQTALLFVDLDYFKEINDTFGHHAGDHVLRAAAARMALQIRTGDTVARLGGDEFVVILHATPLEASAAGLRILESLSQPIPWQEESLSVGASIGIATTTGGDGATPDTLLTTADAALYQAKADGRGRVSISR
jgi:diguanylate cyclase (GGDEF)-like protein